MNRPAETLPASDNRLPEQQFFLAVISMTSHGHFFHNRCRTPVSGDVATPTYGKSA
jgi:hypothetical protein